MSSIVEDRMRAALKLSLVQRAIFCPVNGEVLDVRTCVVFVDKDGDPGAVVSQAGYQTLKAEHPERLETLAELGFALDESTVKA